MDTFSSSSSPPSSSSSSSSSSSHYHGNEASATLLEGSDKRGGSTLVSREARNNADSGNGDNYYDADDEYHRSCLDRFMDEAMNLMFRAMPHTLPLFIVLVFVLIGVEFYLFVYKVIPFYNGTFTHIFLFVLAVYLVYCMYYNYLKACFTSPGSPPVYRQGVFTPAQLLAFDRQVRRMQDEEIPLVSGYSQTAQANAICDSIQEVQVLICGTCKIMNSDNITIYFLKYYLYYNYL